MAERPGLLAEAPAVYSIAAHRGFADALVAGLVPRYGEDDLGLARLTLLLPSQRAARTVTEAFIRHSGGKDLGGLLLPRMAVVGDLDLDETLGALLDPLGGSEDLPPAADPTRRWLRLAAILREVRGHGTPAPALLRQAYDIGRTLDRLLVEGIDPAGLLDPEMLAIVGDQAAHWQEAARTFLTVHAHWQADLSAHGEIDAPERRNRLFDRAAQRWREAPPATPIVAAGVTSASPALARLLRAVADSPRGAVILPDLDLALDDEVWEGLGLAGMPEEVGGPPFGAADAVTHPQYHLKLLLGRMGVARGEVRPWHRAGLGAAPPARSRAISNLFLPPAASASWVDLPEDQRRLAGVRLMESADPAEQAQAIALLIREALEQPERRVALITPDRGLAGRVIAHLQRWDIQADDTAGRPLPQTAAGRVLLLLAEVAAEQAAPVPLLALLGHPLVMREGDRAAWLDNVRRLDRALRGPRPAPGLDAIAAQLPAEAEDLRAWWQDTARVLAPLLDAPEGLSLADRLDALVAAAGALCGDGLWGEAEGRSLAAFVEDLRAAANASAPPPLAARDLPAVLRDAMDRTAVRPPWGGHPRIAIYGLLEARMSRADLVICAGLHEGTWPAAPAPEPLLPPALLRRLGVPGGDFRIGLSAHDLAGALGAPDVVLSWARRDEAGPVIPSRFVLRVQAMLGRDLARRHADAQAVQFARQVDRADPAPPYPRPQPVPSAAQRRVKISATQLDRLRGDPYQFYASKILRLSALDPIDAEPSAAEKGTAAHAVLDKWQQDGARIERLGHFVDVELTRFAAHPLAAALWRPRLENALRWIAERVVTDRAEGRLVLATEAKGEMAVRGITFSGVADRIDRTAGGHLAIVDYKSGMPPSSRQVEEGFALQLGTLGLIAAAGGFPNVGGEPDTFEYWSLGRDTKRDGFGYITTPLKIGGKRSGIPPDDFLPESERYLHDALDRWILGHDPFTARLNPDLGGFNDFDQLMRLDEWLFDLLPGDAG